MVQLGASLGPALSSIPHVGHSLPGASPKLNPATLSAGLGGAHQPNSVWIWAPLGGPQSVLLASRSLDSSPERAKPLLYEHPQPIGHLPWGWRLPVTAEDHGWSEPFLGEGCAFPAVPGATGSAVEAAEYRLRCLTCGYCAYVYELSCTRMWR